MISRFRSHWRRIIFQSSRWDEKSFDVLLIIAISLSVIVVMLESIPSISAELRRALYVVEWVITILFTLEYILRLYVSLKPLRYARSFFGVVDLLAILPTYLDLFLPGAHYLALLRVLRVLRIFRVLKLVKYIGEANVLIQSMRASARKIAIFIFGVLVLVLIFGSLMYLIEGAEHGFTSIPKSVYWAIVTLTTVGYGDVYPVTAFGKVISGLIALMGIGLVALPTGLISAGFMNKIKSKDDEEKHKFCPHCGKNIEK